MLPPSARPARPTDVLRVLLDEHLTPAIADRIAALRSAAAVVAMRSWRDGTYLGADDATILAAAHDDGLVLVTFDLRTIPPLLREWSEVERRHGGVVLVHPGTFRPSDIGGLANALVELWDAEAGHDWTDRVVFIAR